MALNFGAAGAAGSRRFAGAMARLRAYRGKTGSLRAHLIGSVTGTLGLNIFSKFISLVFGVLIARAMGASDYGVYAYAFAILELVKIPSSLGLPGLVTRNVAVYGTRHEWSSMRGLLIRAHQAVGAMSVVMIALGFAISLLLGGHFGTRTALQTFWLALLLVPILGFSALRDATLRGLHYIVPAQIPESLVRPLVALALVGGLWLLGNSPLTPQRVMGVQIIAMGLAFAVGTYLLLKRLPPGTRTAPARFETKRWLFGALPFLVNGGLFLINGQTDIVMLGWFTSSADVGIYRVAAMAAGLIGFGLAAANNSLGPVFARLHEEGDLARLQRILTRGAQATLLFGLPVALVFILFGRQILGLVFGREYIPGATPLTILAVGQLVSVGVGSVGQLLEMTGHARDTAHAIALSAALNIALNAVLIPAWGVNGAALATTISITCWKVLLAHTVKRRLGLRPTAIGPLV